jgi:hypothetical protein
MRNFIILSLFLFVSCEKDNKSNVNFQKDFSINAGERNDSVLYYDIDPDFKILYKETSCLSYHGVGSLALFNNSSYDFEIDYNVVIPDLNHTCDCEGDCFPWGHQIIKLAKKNQNYQIATDSGGFIHQFSASESISKDNKWDTSLVSYFANTTFPNWRNDWIEKDNKYIGVRLIQKDTLYGWIRISYHENLIFHDFGLKSKK